MFASVNTKQCTDTGMAMTLILLLVAVFFVSATWPVTGALVALLVTMICPRILKPLAFLWFAFSELLGSVMSRVILTIIFFAIIVPIGWLSQRIRKDPLKLEAFNVGKKSETLFRSRVHKFSKDDLRHPY